MDEKFMRTELLLGSDAMMKLKNSRVIVFGAGGVGGYVIEALARSGVGSIDIVDNDIVSVSNINRQILALTSTVGEHKVEVAKRRVLDINPNVIVDTHNLFYMPENAENFDLTKYDYIVDAIDTITAKLELIVRAKSAGIPIISSMGTGNKLDATKFEIEDIYKTSVCPLAKVMRYELKRRNVKELKVLYSKEIPKKLLNRSRTPASCSFVPPVAGLIIAGEVIKDLTK